MHYRPYNSLVDRIALSSYLATPGVRSNAAKGIPLAKLRCVRLPSAEPTIIPAWAPADNRISGLLSPGLSLSADLNKRSSDLSISISLASQSMASSNTMLTPD